MDGTKNSAFAKYDRTKNMTTTEQLNAVLIENDEIKKDNARLLGLLSEVFQCIEYAERCGGLDSVTEIKVRRALSDLPNVQAQR
jgi:hypothetical protein